ncbi:MAG: tRNA glutamyl-Q(34) synthetase GluQRS [Gammaproteobacteria bacterium]|nr:MAG: tRNA glutamyl-Q(34) synthetase GluQRS [Gammaproteobacteria bacterium]
MTASVSGPDLQNARPVGRFAPTPSGPLHFGSLLAALGSFLDTRSRGGQWKLRIDDLDTPRVVPGAIDTILRQLEACGLYWDDEPLRQSTRREAHDAALETLKARGLAYPCACSRRELRALGLPGPHGPIYPGTCREGLPEGRKPRAIRVRVPDRRVCVDDRLQGRYCQHLGQEIGDFIVLRADGIVAYQLATVVDDAFQGVTDVVRGFDLLDSTPRQRYLLECLDLPLPRWMHLPVILGPDGLKLAKQNRARPIPLEDPAPWMWAALHALGMDPPAALRTAPPETLLEWALPEWSAERLPRREGIPLPEGLAVTDMQAD